MNNQLIRLFILLHLILIATPQTDFSTSDKKCIQKLSPILQSFIPQEQEALVNNIWKSPEEKRCFDPSGFKPSIAKLTSTLNTNYAELLGNYTHSFITSFECILTAGKKTLLEKEVEDLKMFLSNLTPYGSYPTYTNCLANFIKNVNYVLMTRRRFLLTTNENMERFAVKSTDGLYNGFTWKIKERNIIVNEFLRYQVCVSSFAFSISTTLKTAFSLFANSQQCGVSPGALDIFLYGYNKSEDQTVVPPIEPVKVVNGSSGEGSTGSVEPTIANRTDTKSSVTTKEEIVSSSNSTSTNSNTINYMPAYYYYYNPCQDYSLIQPEMGVATTPTATTTVSSNSASTSSIAVDKAINSTTTTDVKASIDTIIDGNYFEFCPNLIGKNLNVYEAYIGSNDVERSLALSPSYIKTIISSFSSCPNMDIIVKLNKIDSYKSNYLAPFAIKIIKSELKDSSTFEKTVFTMINQAYSNTLPNGDYSLICTSTQCICDACNPVIKFGIEFTSMPYAYTYKTYSAIVTESYAPDMLIANNFYLNISKCGQYVALFLTYQSYIDIRYIKLGESSSDLRSESENIFKKCYLSGLRDEQSSCDNMQFMKIQSQCKKSLQNECQVTNLPEKLEQIYPEKIFTKECDYNRLAEADYDSFAANCFVWINKNLIDYSLILKVSALKTINELLYSDNTSNIPSSNLRVLGTSSCEVVYDNSDVDSDGDSNVDKESKLGSGYNINIDGSRSLIISEIAVDTSSYQTITAATANGSTAKTSSNTYSPTLSENKNGVQPPTLDAHYLSPYIALSLLLLLIF